MLGDDAQDVANKVELALAQVAQAAHLVDQRPERRLLVDIQLPGHGRYQGLDLLGAEPGLHLAQRAGDQGRQVALHASGGDRGGRLAREDGQQLHVAHRERWSRVLVEHLQHAHGLVVCHQRHRGD